MTRILMIDGVEYETGAELSHLLDHGGVELPARISEHDDRGYETEDDGLAPAKGLLWAFGIEFLVAVVAWIAC